MCTVLLPPGGNPIAVNKYIFLILHQWQYRMPCGRNASKYGITAFRLAHYWVLSAGDLDRDVNTLD
jgi:hypothetical protein